MYVVTEGPFTVVKTVTTTCAVSNGRGIRNKGEILEAFSEIPSEIQDLKSPSDIYLTQNSQAVKKVCGPQKGYGEKRCEIQGGGQEMAVMVG